ncbi:MAG: IMPACT family protein [Christensenellales bacterium]|jgi:uncharacterized YigZ family protein
MITVRGRTETTLVVKKSRFIGLVCRVSNEAEAQPTLEERRRQHRDARHHCFAYLLESGAMRCSDDGEPQGTAGQPMLEVLKRSGLTDVLVVSTRYFGGILLGAPGLVRAYTQSAADTLKAAPKVELVPCRVYNCTFDFASWARVQTPLTQAGYVADDVSYTDAVRVRFLIQQGMENRFLNHVQNLTQGQTVPEYIGDHMMERGI